MTKAPFTVVALLLVMLAIGLDLSAKHYYSKGLNLRARSLSAPIEQRETMKGEATRFSTTGQWLTRVGMLIAVFSLISLVRSFKKREPAFWRSIPVALIISYILLQFILI